MAADTATIALRLDSQQLSGQPASRPEDVAKRLLAIQAQELRGARLAIRARSAGLRASDVDRALSDSRSLVVSWLNRGTLHLVPSEDYGWLHSLTAPTQLAANRRRLAEEGLDPAAVDRGVRAIVAALREEGPLAREQLRDRLATQGVRTEGQAIYHLLLAATLAGEIVRGPISAAGHCFVLVRDWLDEPGTVDRERALAELARRYLLGHGPANERDLAKWAGLPLREARRGLEAISPELEPYPDELVKLRIAPSAAALPPPKLLGPFDPLLHGWVSREEIVGAERGVVTSNGVFRPFALVDGRAAALWRMSRGKVELEPLAQLASGASDALEKEARAVEEFLTT